MLHDMSMHESVLSGFVKRNMDSSTLEFTVDPMGSLNRHSHLHMPTNLWSFKFRHEAQPIRPVPRATNNLKM